jgi:hypothetical protein
MTVFTEEERAALTEAAEGSELVEERFLIRPAVYPKPYTEEHLKDILFDIQMRVVGAGNFGHGLAHDGVWSQKDRREYEDMMDGVAHRIIDVSSQFGD